MKYLLLNEESDRVFFRQIAISDFNAWLPFFKNPASFQHWKMKRELPEEECKKWFARQEERYLRDEGGMNTLIEKNTDKLIGYAGLLVQMVDDQSELEIGYSLLPEFWHKGYATEAARKCLDFAFENNFAESLISIISLSNTPSAKIATKNGMKIEKRTTYKENVVNIFRIDKEPWRSSKTI